MSILESWRNSEISLIEGMCEASHSANQHSLRLLTATYSHTLSDSELRDLLAKIKNDADKLECLYKHLEKSFNFPKQEL